MERVIAVFREGVYRHECVGIFTTYDLAFQAARAAADADVDSYHRYEGREFILNHPVPIEPGARGTGSPLLIEAPILFSVCHR